MSKNDLEMTQYVLYCRPSDFPNDYVVREWLIKSGKIESLGITVKAPDLDTIYQRMNSMGLYYMPRQTDDDPCIMGVWM